MDETAQMEQMQMPERTPLADLCSKCLLFVLHLRSSGRYGDPQTMRQRCKELLAELEEEGARLGVEAEDMQAVKYALVAFIDETVLSSDWDQKDYWAANPLQLEIYKHYVAGEKFFELLNQAQTRPQILEVFYLCMVLGFKGKYRLRQQENMQPLIEETQATLRRLKGQGQPLASLSPRGERDEAKGRFYRRLPLWIAPIAAVVVGLFSYYSMSTDVSGEAERTLQSITQVG